MDATLYIVAILLGNPFGGAGVLAWILPENPWNRPTGVLYAMSRPLSRRRRADTGEDRAEKGKICEKVIASKGFDDYYDVFGN